MKQRIAFLGGGNMARAMIGGLLRAGAEPGTITVGEPLAEVRAQLHADFGVSVSDDNNAVVTGAQQVVLAVKPQEAAAVLGALRPALQAGQPLLLSIAAGVRCSALQGWSGGLPAVRAMPNRPALLGAGITALYAPPTVSHAQRQLAELLLQSCGRVVWVGDESQMDIVTAVSGSGPAYFFLLAERLAAAATGLGLDAATALTLAAETLYGAGQMAHLDADLARQRAAVTSKGGTTEAALAVLAAPPVSAAIDAAVSAAAVRSAELAQQFR
jgi:pyrroline-5-carboxylate reductase